MIEVVNVSKAYGETVVLRDLSLSLGKGGVTALIGPNGAGKSTLLSMIGRLIRPDSGEIRIDGHDVATASGDQMARRLSLLRQDNHIGARLTVWDLVTFGRYPYSKGRYTAEDRVHVERAIDFLELRPFAHRFLDELSGGQRQRAFIAMIVCQDTDYVLFDEPLNNLDMKHSVSIMKLVRRTCTELGKTAIVVLHDVNFAARYADRIVAMRDGEVMHDGPPEAVIRAETLSGLYETPVSVERVGGQLIADFY
jgi:iron complex transport system ATP-binding protein